MSELNKKLKRLGLKILVGILTGLIYIKRYSILFLFFILSPIKYIGRWLLDHLILRLYRTYLFVRRTVLRTPIEQLKKLYYFLFPKFILHFSVMVITLATAGHGLYAQVRPPENFGTKNLLNTLVSQDEELAATSNFIEEVGPYQPAKSYLEQKNYLTAQPKEERQIGAAPSVTPKTEGYLAAENTEFYTIPETRNAVIEYIIQPGDTVSDLAEQFGLSVNTILWANNLSALGMLRPGQKLQIPPVSGILYKVAKNDTLEAIAKKYKSDKDKILAFNPRLGGAALTIGETIIIPDGVIPYVAPRVVAPPTFAPANVIPGMEMLWPAPSHRITQYFKWNHAAIDIGLPTGNSVWAADDGIVEYSGWSRGGWGNTIVLNHGDGRKTRYSHLSKALAAVGNAVTKGQVIALSGNTGRSTGPHLDFRIYINGRTVNPLYYIK